MSQAKPDDTQKQLERSVRVLWAVTALIGMVALASLAVNALMVIRLTMIRNAVADTLTGASHSLDNLAGQRIAFDFPISQTVVFEGDIPIKQDLTVPIKTNLPVNTVVSIPIDLGPLGSQTINVPVNTSVPVDVRIPVHIEQTVHIKTDVPVNVNVPVRLNPNDEPLRGGIAQLRAWLENIRRQL
jgi:hypothetical protein